MVAKSYLTKSSEYFTAATSDKWHAAGSAKKLHLPDYEPTLFDCYVQWLYTRKLSLQVDPKAMHGLIPSEELEMHGWSSTDVEKEIRDHLKKMEVHGRNVAAYDRRDFASLFKSGFAVLPHLLGAQDSTTEFRPYGARLTEEGEALTANAEAKGYKKIACKIADVKYGMLLNLYEMGWFLLDAAFRNAVIDAMLNVCESFGKIPSLQEIQRSWEMLPSNCKMRQLIVQLWVIPGSKSQSTEKEDSDDDWDLLPSSFTYQLTLKLFQRLREACSDKGLVAQLAELRSIDRSRYHDHDIKTLKCTPSRAVKEQATKTKAPAGSAGTSATPVAEPASLMLYRQLRAHQQGAQASQNTQAQQQSQTQQQTPASQQYLAQHMRAYSLLAQQRFPALHRL